MIIGIGGEVCCKMLMIVGVMLFKYGDVEGFF